MNGKTGYIEGLICGLEDFANRNDMQMVCMVENLLDKPLPVLTEAKFSLFEKCGNRLEYENDYIAKRKILTVFGVAALRMKEEKLVFLGKVSWEDVCQKLISVMVDVCGEFCWALPAHVNRGAYVNWHHTIDLFAAETAGTLAYLVHELGDWLGEDCCDLVRTNVNRRVLEPFFTSPADTYVWEYVENNWNAVCNGNVGAAYLHLLRPGEDLNEAYIARICKNLCHYIDGFADDGTCMEGMLYYDYGMTYFVYFAMELFCISGGKIDLLVGEWSGYRGGDDKRAKIAAWWTKCYFASGRVVSFSDSSTRCKYRMGLACALAMRYPEIKMPGLWMAGGIEDDITSRFRFVPYKLDYFCTREYIKQLKKRAAENERGACNLGIEVCTDADTESTMGDEEFLIMDSAQWCIGKAANGVGMACKGGHNGEFHNHNDLGSFLYVVGDDMLLADLGRGEYTKKYFSKERYDVFCNSSFGHNVPIVCGKGQLAGREYKCSVFEAKEEENVGIVDVEFSGAYGTDFIHEQRRRYVFNKKNGDLEITDVFASETREVVVTENLVTQYHPCIEENRITLSGESGSCHITIDPAPRFVIKTETHTNPQGERETVYQIQWDVAVKDKTKVHMTVKSIQS